MPRKSVYLLAGMALLASAGAGADTLLIEGLERARATAAERPGRGLTMSTVETRWGSPQNRDGPVGQPPITRWVYPGFVVVFEYQHVVHSVSRPRD